ncbi:MAG TPA: hypothetical protein VM098_05475 [Phycisphaerae bacterium]|nr:hypothetical protein [Phycisphaerae bacterium]
MLSRAKCRKEEYKPAHYMTDSYPAISITAEVEGGALVFFTESQSPFVHPWAVGMQKGEPLSVTDPNVIHEALAKLDDYVFLEGRGHEYRFIDARSSGKPKAVPRDQGR